MAAPPLLALRDAGIAFGGHVVFSGVDIGLGRGDRTCLVGRNGSGKSTLMKMLAGDLEPDSGERFVQPGIRIARLPQEPVFPTDMSVAGWVALDGDPAHEVDAVLAVMKLDGARSTGTLSGGEGRRVALARAFVGQPDILLLDEPTNHLDLAGIEWLEARLASFPGALLTVSHDRTFLATVTGSTWWLDRARLRRHDRGFSAFDDWSEAVLREEEKALARVETKLAAETRWLLRGVTARRKRNQGRLRKLEDLRASRAAFLGGRSKARMEAHEGELRSRLVIEARDISFAFPDAAGEPLPIVRDFSTRILRGDRIGIIGPNGAGKTTLLRLLTGQIAPDSGNVRLAKTLRPAFFDQRRASLVAGETLQQILCPGGGDQVMAGGRARHVTGYLRDFLFTVDQVKSPVSTLSGGERNRLLLARILAAPSDLLVLDEPTNDLDMDTLDLLQEMVADYDGTLLLVSHDRDFLDRTVSGTIVLEGDGRAVEYPGGYRDWLAQRGGGGRAPATDADGAGRNGGGGRRRQRAKSPRNRLGYVEQRELDALPDRIAELGAAIAGHDEALADAGFYGRDPTGFARRVAAWEEARADLGAAEARWLELEERRETLAAGDPP